MPEQTKRDLVSFAREVVARRSPATQEIKMIGPDGNPLPGDPFQERPSVKASNWTWDTIQDLSAKAAAKLKAAGGGEVAELTDRAVENVRGRIPDEYVEIGNDLNARYMRPISAAVQPYADDVGVLSKQLVKDGEDYMRATDPQYKYDRSIQEYLRLMEKAGAAVDMGEL